MGEPKARIVIPPARRPKWHVLTGAMRSLSVPKDIQIFPKRKVGGKSKGRPSTPSRKLQGGSKTSSWMSSDDEEDDDDFAELSDFEIDEDECEGSRLSDTFRTCLSTDIDPIEASNDWNHDTTVSSFSSFNPRIKSTPIEKEAPADENDSSTFGNGILTSSTPKQSKKKLLHLTKFEIEENHLPWFKEKPSLDLEAHLYDNEEVNGSNNSLYGEVSFNDSSSPNPPSHLDQTLYSTSPQNPEAPRERCEGSLQEVTLCVSPESPKLGKPDKEAASKFQNSSIKEIAVPVTSEMEGSEEDDSFLSFLKQNNPEEECCKSKRSASPHTSLRLDEESCTRVCSRSPNKVYAEDVGRNHEDIPICVLTKLERKFAFRRRKSTDLSVIKSSEKYDFKNIPICCLVAPPPSVIEHLKNVKVQKKALRC